MDDAAQPTTLESTYALRELLGEGAFGRVYAGIERATGRPVALKRLERESATSLRRLTELVPRLRALAHPAIVRIDGLVGAGDGAWLAMERIVGVPLLDAIRPATDAVPHSPGRATMPLAFGTRLQEDGRSAFVPLPSSRLPLVRTCFAQLADALEALHGAGIAHRDVTPANILVEASGRVVLLDFGLARTIGEPLEEGEHALAGTADYLAPDAPDAPGAPDAPDAPDAASAAHVDAAGDVYALGVILFEALTGALPFAGAADEVMVRKATVSAPSPSFVLGKAWDAPDALDRLCVEMLRRVGAQRPSAGDVAKRMRG